ncbi:hypothetical protein [Paenibacillus sp. yr247]|uniref:hypothetical protein n=1 Tax=Paenibacillus sp. yr247 TaxID=1761880 RepID=UPI0020C90544|nr:hypothetical protein [Paenibacillus sp. yr247]
MLLGGAIGAAAGGAAVGGAGVGSAGVGTGTAGSAEETCDTSIGGTDCSADGVTGAAGFDSAGACGSSFSRA